MILSVGPHDISGCIKCNWLTFFAAIQFRFGAGQTTIDVCTNATLLSE